MFNKLSLAMVAISLSVGQAAFAQQCNLGGAPNATLRSPLINGASSAAPFVNAPDGQPPAIGDGATPEGTVPGHNGPTTLLPWVPRFPPTRSIRVLQAFHCPSRPLSKWHQAYSDHC